MNYVIKIHELFWEDVKEAKIYYETVSISPAGRFDYALNFSLKKLTEQPESYFNVSKKNTDE